MTKDQKRGNQTNISADPEMTGHCGVWVRKELVQSQRFSWLGLANTSHFWRPQNRQSLDWKTWRVRFCEKGSQPRNCQLRWPFGGLREGLSDALFWPLKRKILFLIVYVCLHRCTCTGACGDQIFRVGVIGGYAPPTWELGTKLESM